jgi:hypothetical protein
MDLSGVVLLVIGDVPVDSEAPVVTSSVPAQSFGGAHRGRVCLHMSDCAYVLRVCICTCVIHKKKLIIHCENVDRITIDQT